MTSACDVLLQEPSRFIDYLLGDPNIRKSIMDKKSFAEAMKKAFASDPTLQNILDTLRTSGESIEVCGINIYNDSNIQALVEDNKKRKLDEFQKRVKKQHPNWRKDRKEKEALRRLKISISSQVRSIKSTKQVTIQDSLKPIHVSYKRGGKVISYRKNKYRPLNAQELMLLENAVKRGKTPAETVNIYLQANLGYRSKTSIKRHFYRIKDKI